MEFVNTTPFPCITLPGQVNFPGNSLTLIVKGTFRIRHGETAVIADEQLFPTGDEFYPDDQDGVGSLRYASDFAHYKPSADLLLVGTCYPAGGESVPACHVSFRVGGKSKTLALFGDRHWSAGGGISNPRPFREMELRYEKSFGGIGYGNNPVGRGFSGQGAVRPGQNVLPNIEHFHRLVVSRNDQPGPAGFGPLHSLWTQRVDKLGTYDQEWVQGRWPWFPADFDWTYYNTAQDELRMEGYLKGDEMLAFEYLHPEHSKYSSRLPGVSVRCLVSKPDKAAAERRKCQEVALRLDTLWIDMDEETLVLVWRGVIETAKPGGEDIEHIFLCTENEEEPVDSLENLKQRFQRGLAALLEENLEEEESEEVSFTDLDIDGALSLAQKDIDAEIDLLKKALEAAGIESEAVVPAPTDSSADRELEERLLKEHGIFDEDRHDWTRERVAAHYLEGGTFADQDLRGLDLSGLDLNKAVFSNAYLQSVNFRECGLAKAVFLGSNCEQTDFSGADLQGTVFDECDCSFAIFTNSLMCNSSLVHATFDQALLVRADLSGANGEDALFSGANLQQARLVASQFQRADFSRALLEQADFRQAQLGEASMEGANAQRINLTGADLKELRASEGADFTGAILCEATGPESIWENAIMDHADISYTHLQSADFSGASFDNTNCFCADVRFGRFLGAVFKRAQCGSMDLFESSFESSVLTEVVFRDANLYGAEFLNAEITNSDFSGANLTMSKLAGRTV
ncbi:DUF2169 domain-containing protein [Desulfopila sp. IMCC35008]|uniref:DUF2169 family type VI secretion system accessory protein n=1 Tax=Desulfopila sp. IMCC35008 TaxID=2653858 RepID=UPI0013CFAF9D|nr:DUF2169 domain-containing protein [Desulfopila sp. IMCC35008]